MTAVLAAVSPERVPRHPVVETQDFTTTFIAESLHHRGMTGNVGKDHGAKSTGSGLEDRRSDRSVDGSAEELLHGADAVVTAANRDESSIAQARHQIPREVGADDVGRAYP